MNILFPFVGDSIGGSHWSAINLYKELAKRSGTNPIIILHIANGPLSDFLNNNKIPYEIIKNKSLAGSTPNIFSIIFSMISNLFLIQSFIKNNNINIVHGNDLRINLTWSFATLFTNSKYVWHQRQVLSKSIKWHAIRYISDYIISISNYVHNSLPININSNSKSCISNPFNVSNLNKKQNSRRKINSLYMVSNSSFLIGYVGRIVPCKHIDDILYALSNIITLDSVKDVHLLIIGSGDSNYIKKLNSIIKIKNLENHVTMTGFVDNPSIALSSLDLLVASSYNEPFGRVLVESMLQKTLVLAQKSGGHIEIISNSVNGFLYTNTSADSISNIIMKIISNKFDNEKVIDTAYNLAIKNYSVSSHANQIIPIYNSLIRQ